jgi:hypothetical protein
VSFGFTIGENLNVFAPSVKYADVKESVKLKGGK